MSILYINDYGVVVGMSDGRCKATLQEQCIASIPLEQLEGIGILGQAQLTTALTEYCLLNGIAVSYFSRGGTYFGKLESAAHVNVPRQRLQCSLYDTEFALEFIRREHFEQEDGKPGIYFTKEGVRIFIERMEQKLSTKIQYLPYIDYPLDFRHAIDMQAVQLIKAMEAEDASLYQPLWIR